MSTLFRLIHEGKVLDLDLTQFQAALPGNMQLDRRSDGTYVEVTGLGAEAPAAQYFVDRELDRVFFLTHVKLKAEMCRREVSVDSTARYAIHGVLPPGTARARWTYELAIQLRLWAIAQVTEDPIGKLLLLYQILELDRPPATSTRYSNSSLAPDPRRECKLLRDLVTHAGNVSNCELKLYCDYLGIPHLMLDRTDEQLVQLIASKVCLVEEQAKLALAPSAA